MGVECPMLIEQIKLPSTVESVGYNMSVTSLAVTCFIVQFVTITDSDCWNARGKLMWWGFLSWEPQPDTFYSCAVAFWWGRSICWLESDTHSQVGFIYFPFQWIQRSPFSLSKAKKSWLCLAMHEAVLVSGNSPRPTVPSPSLLHCQTMKWKYLFKL